MYLKKRKGIFLADEFGTSLYSVTQGISKRRCRCMTKLSSIPPDHVDAGGHQRFVVDSCTPRPDSQLEATSFIATLQKRQGLQLACTEEIALRKAWINAEQLAALADPLNKNGYGRYLLSILM
jgi:hypothetical protein